METTAAPSLIQPLVVHRTNDENSSYFKELPCKRVETRLDILHEVVILNVPYLATSTSLVVCRCGRSFQFQANCARNYGEVDLRHHLPDPHLREIFSRSYPTHLLWRIIDKVKAICLMDPPRYSL